MVDNIGVQQTNPQVFSKDKEVVILFLFLNDLTSDDLDRLFLHFCETCSLWRLWNR